MPWGNTQHRAEIVDDARLPTLSTLKSDNLMLHLHDNVKSDLNLETSTHKSTCCVYSEKQSFESIISLNLKWNSLGHARQRQFVLASVESLGYLAWSIKLLSTL